MGAPSEEEIARRAYELYLARAAADGCDLDDWLEAEREVAAVSAPRAARVRPAATASGPRPAAGA
jgi:hypothetical protein